MRYHKIPDEAVRRLPFYLRGLLFSSQDLPENVSSHKLADFLGVNPWQVRKDFSYFGEFGTPGVGYNVEKLIKQIKKILKLNVLHKAVLVGVGNLGAALLTYPGFKDYGFDIVAAFDVDTKKIGKKTGGITVEDASQLRTLGERGIYLAIIAVPSDATQKMADRLVEAGVRGILSFSPQHIIVPKKVKVISINIAMDLARLPYYIPAG